MSFYISPELARVINADRDEERRRLAENEASDRRLDALCKCPPVGGWSYTLARHDSCNGETCECDHDNFYNGGNHES